MKIDRLFIGKKKRFVVDVIGEELYELIPLEHRKEYVENFDVDYFDILIQFKTKNFRTLLQHSFDWESSPQGYDYWAKIFDES